MFLVEWVFTVILELTAALILHLDKVRRQLSHVLANLAASTTLEILQLSSDFTFELAQRLPHRFRDP